MSESINDSPEPALSPASDAQDEFHATTETVDVSILHSALSKDQLRTVALQRLVEVRSQLARLQSLLDSSNREKSIFMTKWMEEVEANKTSTSLYNDVVAELREQVNQLESSSRMEERQRNNRNEAQSQPPNQAQTPPEQPPPQPIRVKVPEPDKFSGSDRTQNIENFLVAVERFLRLSRVDTVDKIDTTAGFFSGVALDWWISIERSEGEQIRKIGWEEFRQMCLKRFMAVTNAEMAMKRIGKWKQSGAVTSYISSFQNLAQQIPASLLPKEARLLYFIDELTIDLQRHVKAMRPESMEDAINFAQSIGNVGYTQGGMSNNSRDNQSYSHSQRQPQLQFHNHGMGTRNQPIYLENVHAEASEVDSNVGVSSPRPWMTVTSPTESSNWGELSYLTMEQRKLYKEGRCFNCKQMGHRRNVCPRSINQKKE
jgi:Ty3 transposon capsid-like protein